MKYASFICLLLVTFTCHAARFNSQASQDSFVNTLLYDLSGKTDAGYYLEIGAADPVYINNTYFFEKTHGWNGVSLDISPEFLPIWVSKRQNPLRIEDATKTAYSDLLASFPQTIDYLSLDVDGYYDKVLQMLPHQEHIFKVITIEHDAYRFGDQYRNEERRILNGLGYHMLAGNVSNSGFAFEDWWIHPSAFSPELFDELTSLDIDNMNHWEIMSTIRSHFNL